MASRCPFLGQNNWHRSQAVAVEADHRFLSRRPRGQPVLPASLGWSLDTGHKHTAAACSSMEPPFWDTESASCTEAQTGDIGHLVTRPQAPDVWPASLAVAAHLLQGRAILLGLLVLSKDSHQDSSGPCCNAPLGQPLSASMRDSLEKPWNRQSPLETGEILRTS